MVIIYVIVWQSFRNYSRMQAAATYLLSLTCSSTWEQMNKGMYSIHSFFQNNPQTFDEKQSIYKLI